MGWRGFVAMDKRQIFTLERLLCEPAEDRLKGVRLEARSPVRGQLQQEAERFSQNIEMSN